MMIHGIKASTTSMAVLYLVECNLIVFRKYRMLYCFTVPLCCTSLHSTPPGLLVVSLRASYHTVLLLEII